MTMNEGRQPCERYQPQMDGNPYAVWENVHECFGPYPVAAGVERCAGRVSFCLNCDSDHHGGGWDTCPAVSREPREVGG